MLQDVNPRRFREAGLDQDPAQINREEFSLVLILGIMPIIPRIYAIMEICLAFQDELWRPIIHKVPSATAIP